MKWYVRVSILFSAFCFKIHQCNSNMKIEKKSTKALATDKLLLNILSKILNHFFYMFVNVKCFQMACYLEAFSNGIASIQVTPRILPQFCATPKIRLTVQ